MPLDPTQQIALRVYLAGQPGRVAAALAVSEPGSRDYGRYLTPAKYEQEYGPTRAQVGAVAQWLTSQGMTITASNENYIAVNATVGQADAAFDTQISTLTHTEIGFDGFSYNDSGIGTTGGFSVPAALGTGVATVTGLDIIEPDLGPDAASTNSAASIARAPGAGTSRTGSPQSPIPVPTPAAMTQPSETYQCSQYWDQYSETIPAAYGQTSAPTQLCGYTVSWSSGSRRPTPPPGI